MQLLKDNRQNELKKHVNAIHSTNTTLLQRKLFNALLYHAYPDLPHQSQFVIPAKTLCRLIGYKSNDYATLKKALVALMKTVIEWSIIEQSSKLQEKWQASSVLASAEFADGICTYEFSSVMRKLLYRPEMYGRIDVKIIPKFKSNYGLALYENCIRFQGLPYTPWFTTDTFRQLMGVPKDKHTAFNYFKATVINIAVAEVNSYSPLHIEPELERLGRQVSRIRFKLRTKSGQEAAPANLANGNHPPLSIQLTRDFNLSPSTIRQILSNYELSYVEEKVEFVLQSESYRNGKVKDVSAYLINALKQDYKAGKTSKQLIEEQRQQREMLKENEAHQERKLGELKIQYGNYVTEVISQYCSQLETEDSNALLKGFESALPPFDLGVYRKYGLKHALIRGSYNNYILERRGEHLKHMIGFEDFVNQYTEETAN